MLQVQPTGSVPEETARIARRPLNGGQEEKILDILLERLKARGWLKAGGKQRTDAGPRPSCRP